MIRYSLFLTICIILIVGLTGCKNSVSNDSIEGQQLIKYSSLLKMNKQGDMIHVKVVNPWDTTENLATYLLVPEACDISSIDTEETIIKTPVSSLLVYTSVYASAIKELGMIDVVTGVTDSQFYKIPEISSGLKSGKVIDAGKSDSPIKERIIDLSPEAIMLTIYQGMESEGVDRLGIPVLKFVDNMEVTPLGRAEWIKLIGALVGKEVEADSIFTKVEREYMQYSSIVAQAKQNPPTVMVENMYQGVWYVSGGGSYQAAMIRDAGGDYIWKDDKSRGSLNLSFEQVYDKAHDADIWLLKLFGEDLTKDILRDMDERNMQFKAANEGGVYYANTAEVNMFEEFPFHPQLMLKDYIKIFHPSLMPDYTLRYFKQMNQ